MGHIYAIIPYLMPGTSRNGNIDPSISSTSSTETIITVTKRVYECPYIRIEQAGMKIVRYDS